VAQQYTVAPLGKKTLAAIVIPLFLDSAFQDGKYKFGNQMPNFLLPGIEFYNGVKIAADELKELGISARIRIIDSKSTDVLDQLFKDSATEKPGLVITLPKNVTEMRQIADPLRGLNIPLISLLPSDAGITGYPNLLIPNSTLATHCRQLYRFLQRQHSLDNIVMLKITGSVEDKLREMLSEENNNSLAVKLKWKELNFTDNLLAGQLTALLDSTRQNVIIAPTLNTTLAQKIVKFLSAGTPNYSVAVVGMPTWESIAFNKPEYKKIDVYYGTPFVSASGNADLFEQFNKKYRLLTNSRPSDVAIRGYEITRRYIEVLAHYPNTFIDHINDEKYKLFSNFNFQPVGSKSSQMANYHENQKIYFIKKTDGVLKDVLTL
jgi:hypothetical protein